MQDCKPCELNKGYYTDYAERKCYSICGDSFRTADEECDDGN